MRRWRASRRTVESTGASRARASKNRRMSPPASPSAGTTRARMRAARAAGAPCTRLPGGRDASMSASTSGQAEPPTGPGARATPRGDSTSGQRATLAGRLRRHVATLEGVRHPHAAPERHRAARDYVAAELAALGLTVALAPFTFRGRTHHNVVATRAGRDARRPRLLVGAHFDSTADTPGADDNASGVAAMIECARLVATRAAPPEGGLEFVGFDLEEQQTTTYRVGSRRLARRCPAGGQALAGALILPMVGHRHPTPRAPIVPPFLGIDVPR